MQADSKHFTGCSRLREKKTGTRAQGFPKARAPGQSGGLALIPGSQAFIPQIRDLRRLPAQSALTKWPYPVKLPHSDHPQRSTAGVLHSPKHFFRGSV